MNLNKSMPRYRDNRHTRAITVSLNKYFCNTSALHKHLANIISEFSHTIHLTGGSYLVSADLKFFVVQTLLSNHWCVGWFCPSRIALVSGTVTYIPNFFHRGQLIRKRINNPFGRYPCINVRKKRYYLQSSVPKPFSPITLFAQMYGQLL